MYYLSQPEEYARFLNDVRKGKKLDSRLQQKIKECLPNPPALNEKPISEMTEEEILAEIKNLHEKVDALLQK